MKHLPIFVLATAVAASGSAHTIETIPTPTQHNLTVASPQQLRPIKDPNAADIIIIPPAGETRQYARSGGAYLATTEGVKTTIYEGIATEMVEAADGYTYMLNPISQADTDSYIKLKREGSNKMVAELPQAVTSTVINGQTITLYANRMNYSRTSADGKPIEGTYVVDAGNNTITYTLTADGRWQMEGGQQNDMILGFADQNGNWYGYGEFNTAFTPFNHTKTTLPEGLEEEPWSMTYGYDGHFIAAAITGNDIYIKGICSYFPESWIKGEISGTVATFPSEQFLGIANGRYCFFHGADIVPVYNEFYDDYDDIWHPNAAATFTFDPATQTLTGSNAMMITTFGEKQKLQVETFYPATLRPRPATTSLTPADPIISEFEPYDDAYGFGAVEFMFPVTNTDGLLLDKSHLYYRLHINGAPLTFSPDDYIMLKQEMQLIPFDFDDQSDILSAGARHTVFFYTPTDQPIGIQTVYIDGEEEHLSAMVTTKEFGSITGVAASDALLTNTEWFDLSGRKVINPGQGIYIVRSTYSDGTVIIAKTARR